MTQTVDITVAAVDATELIAIARERSRQRELGINTKLLSLPTVPAETEGARRVIVDLDHVPRDEMRNRLRERFVVVRSRAMLTELNLMIMLGSAISADPTGLPCAAQCSPLPDENAALSGSHLMAALKMTPDDALDWRQITATTTDGKNLSVDQYGIEAPGNVVDLEREQIAAWQDAFHAVDTLPEVAKQ